MKDILQVILLILLFAIYFLPSIVGANKKNFSSIFVLNFFLGWTLVGWVVALAWAVSQDDNTNAKLLKIQAEQKNKIDELNNIRSASVNSVADEIKKLNELKEQNLISEDEFISLRKKVLDK